MLSNEFTNIYVLLLYLSHCLLQCHLFTNFANRLDPCQAQQNFGPDMDPICLTLRRYSWNNFLEKKISRQKKPVKLPRGQRAKIYLILLYEKQLKFSTLLLFSTSDLWLTLVSFLWYIGKHCRPRSDQGMHCLPFMKRLIQNEMVYYTWHP